MNEQMYLEDLLKKLENTKSLTIDKERTWLKNIDKKPGVYIIEIDNEIKYVGETGNIKKRMSDLLNTYNHTFRRTIGEYYFENDINYYKASSKRKFHESIELKIDDFIFKKCSVKFLAISLGRKELEELIQEKLYDNLFNKRKKRK